MIKNLTVFFLGLVISFMAPAEPFNMEIIKFSINCKILDQITLKVKEGKSKRYNGYKNGLKIGDNFLIEFFADLHAPKYTISINHSQKDNSYIAVNISEHNYVREDYGGIGWNDFGDYQVLRPDTLILRTMNSQLFGERYYKNDWNMVFTFEWGTELFAQTLNCLSVPDDYNKLLKKVTDIHSTPSKAP